MIDGVIGEIKPGKKTGWEVVIDGVPLSGVKHLEINGGKYGVFHYGERVEGYDSVVFQEPGGGGSVTLMYVKKGHDLYVALIEENRPNMGGKVWCAIGGMLDVGKTHQEQQALEASEEAGVDTKDAEELPGLPVNSNRLFWVADPAKGEGVHMYAIELPEDAMNPDYTLKKEYSQKIKKSTVKFFKIFDLVNVTADTLALTAAFKLLAKLNS